MHPAHHHDPPPQFLQASHKVDSVTPFAVCARHTGRSSESPTAICVASHHAWFGAPLNRIHLLRAATAQTHQMHIVCICATLHHCCVCHRFRTGLPRQFLGLTQFQKHSASSPPAAGHPPPPGAMPPRSFPVSCASHTPMASSSNGA